jgi:pimeloyl-ACP methyl ester carboxylesterase
MARARPGGRILPCWLVAHRTAAHPLLARIGRVVTYDRRGYARSGGQPARSVATHSADAAALLPRASAQDAPRRIIAFFDTHLKS